jgi:hypothetical protein
MGLDQYGYSKDSKGNEVDLQYWRKHNALEGWMDDLYKYKGNSGDGNGKMMELYESDIDRLEEDVTSMQLPYTQGFFFGADSSNCETKRGRDLVFIKKAREEFEKGNRVFYSSNW